MLTVLILDDYVVRSEKGLVLTQDFYNLSLANKYEVVRLCEESGLLTQPKIYDRLIKAILQHSSPEMRRDFPVKGERKPRKEAQAADYLEALQALYIAFDVLENRIEDHAAKNFLKFIALGMGKEQ
jgi:hypothetical protein